MLLLLCVYTLVLHKCFRNGLDEADGGAAKESDSILVVVDALKQLLREMKSSKVIICTTRTCTCS